MVKLGFTKNKVTVKESEGEVELCVSISHTIARPLNFIITHNFIVTGKYIIICVEYILVAGEIRRLV